MREIALSCFPKSAWCLCFRFMCCVRPPGERQAFSQVGHSQRSIEIMGAEGEMGWRGKASSKVIPLLFGTIRHGSYLSNRWQGARQYRVHHSLENTSSENQYPDSRSHEGPTGSSLQHLQSNKGKGQFYCIKCEWITNPGNSTP